MDGSDDVCVAKTAPGHFLIIQQLRNADPPGLRPFQSGRVLLDNEKTGCEDSSSLILLSFDLLQKIYGGKKTSCYLFRKSFDWSANC